jgi:ABC-2 type transport system permease protein
MDKIDWHAVKVLARKEIQQVLDFRKPTFFIIVVSILLVFIFPVIVPIFFALGFQPFGKPLLEGVRFLATFMMPIFLLYPPGITNAIATDSFAGEKERKTIETLLLLPCSNSTLVISKVLVSIFPAFLVLFGGFLSLGIVSNISIGSHGIMIIFNEIEWYMLIFIAAPLFIMVNALCGILASIIARSVKSAQNLSNIPLIPMLFAMMSIAINNIVLTSNVLFMFSGICVLFDIGAAWLCIRFMDRERFLLQGD